MSRSLHTLLARSLDYAGLFPPAKLPLADAAGNYVRYAATADAWLLGKFVCPVAQLSEFAALLPAAPDPWQVSALGTGGATSAAWRAALERDFAGLATLPRDRVQVTGYEVRLPDEAFASRAAVEQCLHAFPRPGGLFVEVPAGPGFLDRTRTTLPVLAAHGFGFKLRCGGLEVAAFPEPALVAEVLAAAATFKVPLKATAGLHHPLRRWDAALGVWMHGFVNLFVAALLAAREELSAEKLAEILDERDPAAFHFADDGLSWRGLGIGRDDIAGGRQDVIQSFGSCSFDEPRDDLRALGWLEGT